MATTPQIRVRMRRARAVVRPEVRNPAEGQKPQSNFLAAARTKGDRNYVPRYDIMEAE